ncbi:MAG: RecQ family ATP-dependent DNA helicase [Chitinophagaceae bacterium]|nr:RecQ family ATP-dependent DNA helicase [Chitinophagaceae bacterium]
MNIHHLLKQYWGFGNFRPLQEEIINSILSGKDVLALMPTGGGKSLCYQVPAMALPGLCLVISPLIALMKDQVEGLRRKNITAFAIYSGMSRKEVINTFKTASESNCKFLYVSPERLETSLFKEYLPGLGINLIAVDEAHCISQWGYDFRPSYLRIANLREELPDVPVLALTASATPEVQKDICDKLSGSGPPPNYVPSLRFAREPRKEGLTKTPTTEESINDWKIFRQSFERPNLSYSVFKVDSKINKLLEVLQKVPGSSIVYCKSRKRTKEISELLQLQKISSDFYHAGLIQEERNRKQEEWISNKKRVIVCTNAFGMGIDKPDVRNVVHADVPDSLENYYQEAGRAGRDGKTSFAVLLYDERDIADLENMTNLHYPSQPDIRNIYQAVANYLQIPSGGGEGQYHGFDISDFLRKFKLNSHTALYSLKALEQEGWLAFNEQVFLPSKAGFTTNKDHLYSFEKDHPEWEPLIKTLLRAYEGIFDQPVPVSEKMIAGLMKKDAEEVKKQLTQLQLAGLISYEPQKDTPQLLILRNRIKAEDLVIDMVAYDQRKEQFRKRTKKMTGYIKEDTTCRSRIIGSYFGDDNVKDCGICDNCLRQKATSLSKEEFETLHHRIINIIKYESLHTKDLLLKLNGIKKEKAWKVLEFLQAENMIEMDDTGMVKLK